MGTRENLQSTEVTHWIGGRLTSKQTLNIMIIANSENKIGLT